MNKTLTGSKAKNHSSQTSILGFVDTPNYETGHSRTPCLEKREKPPPHRGSSSNSTSRKRKLSSIQAIDSSQKKVIMESEQTGHTDEPSSPNRRTPLPMPVPQDVFTLALIEMEARLTKNMEDIIKNKEDTITKNMKEMIEPIKLDINSLVQSQKEWEQHKTDMQDLKVEKKRLNNKIKEVEERNLILEDRVYKLEDRLLECNLIIHGVKESKWELDSTQNELVVQAIADTVEASTPAQKLEIAKKIPIAGTSRVERYNSMQSRPICVSFASKNDAELLLERRKKLRQGIYVDCEYKEEEEVERKFLRPILKAARKHALQRQV